MPAILKGHQCILLSVLQPYTLLTAQAEVTYWAFAGLQRRDTTWALTIIRGKKSERPRRDLILTGCNTWSPVTLAGEGTIVQLFDRRHSYN